MSLYVTGDTHGNIDISKFNRRYFKDGDKLTKDDYVVVLGDFGAVWGDKSFDKTIQAWWGEQPWTTLFVDGNHENHDLLDSYPVEIWNGGKIHRISESIIHLMRGQVYNIDGKKIFTMGGATSIDKMLRKEGTSWWAREVPNELELDEAIANLKNNKNRVDYVFTHCAPGQCLPPYYDHDEVTDFLDIIKNVVKCKMWFCGHYHVDKFEDDIRKMYHDIIKLY